MATLGLILFIMTIVGVLCFTFSIFFEGAFFEKVREVSFDFVLIGIVISTPVVLMAL